MTYYQDIENYIEELARKHKKLLHENGGNAFLPMGIVDEVTSVSNRKKTYLKMMDVSMTATDENTITWVVQFAILRELPTIRTNDLVDEISNETQEIIYDFDARIRALVDENCSFVNRLLNPNIDPVGLTDQSAIGWAYTWRFTTFRPEYNANAWEE